MTSRRLAHAVIVTIAAFALLWGWSAATADYLARIPPDMRARGEAYSDTRLLAFATARLTPRPLEYALFYDPPSEAERVMVAMQWRASAARLSSRRGA